LTLKQFYDIINTMINYINKVKNFLPVLLFTPVTLYAAIHQSQSSNHAVESGSGSDKSCEVARGLAIKNALERHAGIEYDYTKRTSCKEKNYEVDCSFEKSFDVETAGTLKKVIEESVVKIHSKDDLCVVNIVVEIEKTRLLDVEVRGKQRYFSGEPIEYFFETKEPLYLYVFNVYNIGYNQKKAELMYPTERLNNNIVNGKFQFPGTDKVKFTTYVAYGDVSKEQLIFLFTKHKLYDKKEWTVLEIDNMVKSIPTFSRRVVYQDIIIERRLR